MKNNLLALKKYSESEFKTLYGEKGFPVDQIARLKISGLSAKAKLYDIVGVCDNDTTLLISNGIDEKTGLTRSPLKINMERISYWESITRPKRRDGGAEVENILKMMEQRPIGSSLERLETNL
ncbi:hypothetical protein ISS08_01520 [Candidatus Pacearchaeota archaeon]|nr:hypothetical protein [Candidatus Pacearchaeota archaeon]